MNGLTLAFLSLLGVTGRKVLWHSIHRLTGIRFVQPVGYLEWDMVGAEFPAPAAALQKMLPTPRLKPAEIEIGIGTVHLVATDFHRVEIFGPYKELQVNIPVKYETKPGIYELSGEYVFKLPITGEEACRAGRDISGFPKFMADVNFEDQDDLRRCQVWVDNQDLITLGVEKGPVQSHTWTSYLFSVIEGQLLRTPFENCGQWGSVSDQTGAFFMLGDHPIAKEIACLEMSPTPIRHEYGTHISSILRVPEKPLVL